MDATDFDISTSSEFAAAAITCPSLKQPLIFGSIYSPPPPPDNIIEYGSELYTAITTLQERYKEHTVYIGGDTNLPDIDWTSDSVSGNNYAIPISRGFIDVLHDVGSQQIVNFPTKKEQHIGCILYK
ncbi:MAG: hypothetical protein AB2693_15915 [Candidatus Thiodiazotropha sp.]